MIEPWLLRVVVACAVAIGAAVAMRAPGHYPVPVALGASLLLDVLRARVALPYEIAVAICVVPSALGSWVAARVFVPELPRTGLAAVAGWSVVVLFVPAPAQPVVALGASAALQAGLACGWRLRKGSLTVSAACGVVLLVGDVAGILGPAGPLPWPRSWAWLTAVQAALVAIVLTGIQGAWLLREGEP